MAATDAERFGRMVELAMIAKGWGQGRLAANLGELPSGRVFDATGIRRIRLGQRTLDQELVLHLIDVLAPELDPVEAWMAAFPPPPWVTLDAYRAALNDGHMRAVSRLRSRRTLAGASNRSMLPSPAQTARRRNLTSAA